MKNPSETEAIKSDVLHSDQHSHLSAEEIAKAVARHKREHPSKNSPPPKPQKKG